MTHPSTSAARQLAILGSPVAQALSPVLHRAAYTALGLDCHWTYRAIDCTLERLPSFLAGLDDGWAGLSLTMPLKRAAVPLLDEVSATVRATGTGTANTVTSAAAASSARTPTSTACAGPSATPGSPGSSRPACSARVLLDAPGDRAVDLGGVVVGGPLLDAVDGPAPPVRATSSAGAVT
ncbi:hypothetical protein [Streptantibioticus ferralitis]|uniref:hypothetical protein n=1 Tax=Streptantibioticus ferralitis TaxID=236510 RepID=UPI0027E27988|nr:hypothetical protein [Streptantibioticus ferralitis]